MVPAVVEVVGPWLTKRLLERPEIPTATRVRFFLQLHRQAEIPPSATCRRSA